MTLFEAVFFWIGLLSFTSSVVLVVLVLMVPAVRAGLIAEDAGSVPAGDSPVD